MELPAFGILHSRNEPACTLLSPEFRKMQCPILSSQILLVIATAVSTSIITALVVAPRHIGVDPTGRKPSSIIRAARTQITILAGGRRIDLTLRLAEQAAEQAALEKVAETRALRIIRTTAERTAYGVAPLAGVWI